VKPSNDVDPEAMNDVQNHLLPRELVNDINEKHKKDVSRVVYMDASDKENKYQECSSEGPVENCIKCDQDSEEEGYSNDRIKLKKLKWIPIHSISRSSTKITPIGYWYYSVTDRQIQMYKMLLSNKSSEAAFEEVKKEIQLIQKNSLSGSMNGWMNFGHNVQILPIQVDKAGWEVNKWPKLEEDARNNKFVVVKNFLYTDDICVKQLI